MGLKLGIEKGAASREHQSSSPRMAPTHVVCNTKQRCGLVAFAQGLIMTYGNRDEPLDPVECACVRAAALGTLGSTGSQQPGAHWYAALALLKRVHANRTNETRGSRFIQFLSAFC